MVYTIQAGEGKFDVHRKNHAVKIKGCMMQGFGIPFSEQPVDHGRPDEGSAILLWLIRFLRSILILLL